MPPAISPPKGVLNSIRNNKDIRQKIKKLSTLKLDTPKVRKSLNDMKIRDIVVKKVVKNRQELQMS